MLDDVRGLLRQAERLAGSLGNIGARGASGRVLISAPSAFARLIMRDWRVEETALSAIRASQRLAPPRTVAVLEFLAQAASGWGVAAPAT